MILINPSAISTTALISKLTMAENAEETKAVDAKLEDAKRFLCKESPSGGVSLYEHLTQVLLKLIVERPEGANAQFEALSLAVRRLPIEAAERAAAEAAAAEEYAKLVERATAEAEEAAAAAAEAGGGGEEEGEDAPPPPAPKMPPKPLNAEEAYRAKVVAWVDTHKQYLWPTPPPPEPEDGAEPPEEEPEPEDPGTAGQCSNVLDDAVLWSWAGVGFGSDQTYRLFRSLQLLAGREGDDCKVRCKAARACAENNGTPHS